MSAFEDQVGGDHYKKLSIQPAQFCMANGIPFMEGSVIKYVTRWRGKGGVEDLRKARHFLDMLIEDAEKDRETEDMFERDAAALEAVYKGNYAALGAGYKRTAIFSTVTVTNLRPTAEKGYENGN